MAVPSVLRRGLRAVRAHRRACAQSGL